LQLTEIGLARHRQFRELRAGRDLRGVDRGEDARKAGCIALRVRDLLRQRREQRRLALFGRPGFEGVVVVHDAEF